MEGDVGQVSGRLGEIVRWDPAPALPRLVESEAHVFWARLDAGPAAVARYRRGLTPDELRRANSYRFERDRVRSIVSRGILRSVLGRYLGCAPAAVPLRYGPQGKPALDPRPGSPDLRFNLSHAHSHAHSHVGGALLAAVALGREVGIDLEAVSDDVDPDLIANRFYSPAERHELEMLPPHLRQLAFFSCWTRKEAYLKALGAGLSRPPETFDVSVHPDAPPSLLRDAGEDGVRDHGWSFYDVRPGLPFVATLVAAGEPLALRCWRYTEP